MNLKASLASTAFVGFAVLILVASWAFWEWNFCRFYVGPGEIAVITAKNGESLPPGQILAKAGQKGIWKQALGPGRYRLNPVGYKVDLVDAINVPIGYVGVVTSLSGKQPAEGAFAKAGEKGIRADILQPGLYYVNPRAFKIDVLEIGVNQVSLLGKTGGVITKNSLSISNDAMLALQSNVLKQQQAQRYEYVKESSSLMANSAPAPAAIDELKSNESRFGGKISTAKVAEKRAIPSARNTPPPSPAQAQAAFILNQFVEFPSKDGFEISLDMTVEFELLPENIAWVFRNYGDLPAAVEKIIMPQILSVSRLKGSTYGARDFIVGEGREKFQADLTEALAKVLGEKKIIIHNALIRNVNVPMQIQEPIQQAGIAQERDLTNQQKQATAKKQADLNTQLSLIDQAAEQVTQETEKIKANIKADQIKKVAEIGGETLLQAAEIEKQTAAIRAEKMTTLGKAQAQVIQMVEGERALGYQLKVKAFGDPTAYNLWIFASELNEGLKVNILHSGNGTLWTDLQRAGGLSDLSGAKALQKTGEKSK